MSLIFAFTIFATKLIENNIVEKLDESLQTISDYSLEVKDPPYDADNPDEWYEFFSRFGSVRYISIIRRNDEIIEKLFEKHKCLHKIETVQHILEEQNEKNEVNNLQDHSKYNQMWLKRLDKLHRNLTDLNNELAQLYLKSYKVCRVFVTYEYEEHQRLALANLEVPDLYAKFDLKDLSNAKALFRRSSVLNVVEPQEPDNIMWGHLSYEYNNLKFLRYILSYALCIGALVGVWYAIRNASELNNPTLLGFVIAVFDSLLPVFFEMFTDICLPVSASQKESILQLRLFFARLLLSTLFPYFQTNWNGVLRSKFIQQIITIQISACFISPFITFLDIGNVVRRNIFASCQSETQEEYNLKFSGSEWSLAEKYTGIAKVLFVSLYYATLVPFSLLLAALAFLFMFGIDRYLLLRKWKVAPMFDESVAVRLRQQAILAVAAHMFVTIRFIYSWPMDEAYYHEKSNSYEKVDKYPSWNILSLHTTQEWQSDVQKKYLIVYYLGMLIVFFLAIYVWIIVPWASKIYDFFCYHLKVVGDSQGIPFSEVTSNMICYEPVYPYRETKFLCSLLVNVPKHHRPSFVTVFDQDNHDISYYVPELHRPHVLSVVKYYSKADEEEYMKQKKQHHSLLGTTEGEDDDDDDFDDLEGGRGRLRRLPYESKRGNADDLAMSQIDLDLATSEKKSKKQKKKHPPKRFSSRSESAGIELNALPLHVQLDQQLNPYEHRSKQTGNLPDELKKKIASKAIDQPDLQTLMEEANPTIRKVISLRRSGNNGSSDGNRFSRVRSVGSYNRLSREDNHHGEEEDRDYDSEDSEYRYRSKGNFVSKAASATNTTAAGGKGGGGGGGGGRGSYSSAVSPTAPKPSRSDSPPRENYKKKRYIEPFK
jgi:hypothetical protein